jgi:acyl-homoserine-lactone acylase
MERGTRRVSVFGISLLLLCSCAEDLSRHVPPEGRFDVRILRDEWGVPHIFGKTDADAAYGLAWAQCEDDWTNIEDAILLSRARFASVHGRDFGKFDYLIQLFRAREFAEMKYETDLSEDFRVVLEAYAAGVTHYAAAHRDKMPHIALPVTGADLIANAVFKGPFFFDLQDALKKTLGEAGETVSNKGTVTAMLTGDNLFAPAMPIGSNTWAVAPDRSADGHTRLCINSHMPWEGPVAFYEAHVHSGEGWNMHGATFPAGVMIFMGHDDVKGWCHTISRPDLIDVYRLEINPENPDQYRFDDAWKNFEKGTARIPVKLWGPVSWTFRREMLWSVHGPAFRTEDGVYAFRFAGYGEIRALEEWYRMNKARNLEEFIEAMRPCWIPSLNTLYADSEGNIFYLHNGRFPVRQEGFDWQKTLPGDTSAALYDAIYPFEKLPQILNPESGFAQSCNSTPFHTTDGGDNPDPDDFPITMGLETHLTNRAARALATYGRDSSISRDAFYAYKFDKLFGDQGKPVKYVRKVLKLEVPENDLMREAVALLRAWDRSTEQENRSAALAIQAERFWRQNHGAEDTPEALLGALKDAAKRLKKYHGRLDIPWGAMMRLRRGSVDLPLGGAPDCLRAVDPEETEDGRFTGINGDCWMMMVEWDGEGRVSSEAVHQYGAAAVDTASPHYADQAPLFAEEKFRPVLLTEEAVREHLKREYRPGEISGPWYAQ